MRRLLAIHEKRFSQSQCTEIMACRKNQALPHFSYLLILSKLRELVCFLRSRRNTRLYSGQYPPLLELISGSI